MGVKPPFSQIPFVLHSLAGLLLAGSLCAQSIVHTDLSVTNPKSYGSRILKARLFYPTKGSGNPAPIDLTRGPRPVVVFLAGYSFTGRDYAHLGRAIASRGYLALMNETGSHNGFLLGEDGKAWVQALKLEIQRPGSLLQGAVDVQRIAILGHSMGAANVYRILAEQPGYRVGASIAPLIVPSTYPPKITKPLAVIAGAGDQTTPWQTHAKPSWDAISRFRGTKLFYLLDSKANHMNLAFAGFPGATAIDQAIYNRSVDVSLSFIEHYLDGSSGSFDHCMGKEARSDPHLQLLSTSVMDPVLFEAGQLRLGHAHEIVTIGEPGYSVQLLAATSGQVPTPFGTFLLDPTTTMVLQAVPTLSNGLSRFAWTIPKKTQFAGITLHLQGLCSIRGNAFAFTNALHLTIKP